MDAAPETQPLFVALTADVDPDANHARPGRPDAVSAGAGGNVRFAACFEGLGVLLDVLEPHSLPATLFWEGRALAELAARHPDLLARAAECPSLEHGSHGFRHEDFAGKESGVPLGGEQTRTALGHAGEAFGVAFGCPPRAFRAPYCRLTNELARALGEFGYAYDASVARVPSAEWRLTPYRLDACPDVWELALCRARDRKGRPISGYLWRLFEGGRGVADYVRLIDSVREDFTGGLLQIALHPWHLIVSEKGQRFEKALVRRHVRRLKRLVAEIARMPGVSPVTLGRYLEMAQDDAERVENAPPSPV